MLRAATVNVKSSPRVLASFSEFVNGLKDSAETEKLKKLCPTRWVSRMPAVRASLQNYAHLLDWFQQQILEGKREDKTSALIHINNLSDFSVFFSLKKLMRLFEIVHPVHKWVQGVNITISDTKTSFSTLAILLRLEAAIEGGEFYRECKATSEEINLEAPTIPRDLGKKNRYHLLRQTSKRTSCRSIRLSFKLLSMSSKNASMWMRLLLP